MQQRMVCRCMIVNEELDVRFQEANLPVPIPVSGICLQDLTF